MLHVSVHTEATFRYTNTKILTEGKYLASKQQFKGTIFFFTNVTYKKKLRTYMQDIILNIYEFGLR